MNSCSAVSSRYLRLDQPIIHYYETQQWDKIIQMYEQYPNMQQFYSQHIITSYCQTQRYKQAILFFKMLPFQLIFNSSNSENIIQTLMFQLLKKQLISTNA